MFIVNPNPLINGARLLPPSLGLRVTFGSVTSILAKAVVGARFVVFGRQPTLQLETKREREKTSMLEVKNSCVHIFHEMLSQAPRATSNNIEYVDLWATR